jgi:site-specific DNA-methyltransferase (adenine-specific)
MKSELIKGDSLQELKKYDDNSIDLLCTDPPYGYSFMGRDWDKTLPPKEIFEECFRVLKPGSMAFVMSAPRSDVQYRMTEMLEKVGFRIDYTPIYWTYASGFPKAMNVSKMLEKNGNQKEELDGSYGGFQPKPAVEVVIVAMKPLDKKGYLEQAQDNGKGITWFDDCRIPFEEGYVEPENQTMPDLRDVGKKSKEAIGIDKLSYGQVQNAKRKPYKSDYQKYVEKQKSFKGSETIGTTIKGNEHFLGGDIEQLDPSENFVDESAGRFPANMLVSDKVLDDYSRYFSLDEWFSKNLKSLPEPVQQTFPFMIVPKASKSEKNDGLDNFDTKQVTGGGGGVGDYIDDVNSASGKFGSEKAPSRNIHPTVKPLTLMNYLVTLGSRKGDVVLDPFMGSGTTPLACVSLERKYIGIDNEQDYYEIAKARVDKLEQPLKMWEKFS